MRLMRLLRLLGLVWVGKSSSFLSLGRQQVHAGVFIEVKSLSESRYSNGGRLKMRDVGRIHAEYIRGKTVCMLELSAEVKFTR